MLYNGTQILRFNATLLAKTVVYIFFFFSKPLTCYFYIIFVHAIKHKTTRVLNVIDLIVKRTLRPNRFTLCRTNSPRATATWRHFQFIFSRATCCPSVFFNCTTVNTGVASTRGQKYLYWRCHGFATIETKQYEFKKKKKSNNK